MNSQTRNTISINNRKYLTRSWLQGAAVLCAALSSYRTHHKRIHTQTSVVLNYGAWHFMEPFVFLILIRNLLAIVFLVLVLLFHSFEAIFFIGTIQEGQDGKENDENGVSQDNVNLICSGLFAS